MSTVSTLSGPPAFTRVDGGYNRRCTEPALLTSGSPSGGVDPTPTVNELGTKFWRPLTFGRGPDPPSNDDRTSRGAREGDIVPLAHQPRCAGRIGRPRCALSPVLRGPAASGPSEHADHERRRST